MTIIFYDFYDFIKKGSIRIMDILEEMEKTVEILFKDNIWEFPKPGEGTGFTSPRS